MDDAADQKRLLQTKLGADVVRLQDGVLLGKVYAPRSLSTGRVKKILGDLWKSYPGLHVQDLSNNIFACEFASKNQAEKVLAQAPWFVMGHLFSLQPRSHGQALTEIAFHKVPFWVQVHALPLSCFDMDLLFEIASRVGLVLQMEKPVVNGNIRRPYMRARICIDVSQPLLAGTWISMDGKPNFWINFKYESLRNLCFKCGLIGHGKQLCENYQVKAQSNPAKPAYGKFLYASTPKNLNLMQQEEQKGSDLIWAALNQKDSSQNPEMGISQDGKWIEGKLNNSPGLASAGKTPEVAREQGKVLKQRLKFISTECMAKVVWVEMWQEGVKKGLGYIDWVDEHRVVLYTFNGIGMGVSYKDLIQHPIGGWDETLHYLHPAWKWNQMSDTKWGKYDLFEIGEDYGVRQERATLTPIFNQGVSDKYEIGSSSRKRPWQEPSTLVEVGRCWKASSKDGKAVREADREVKTAPRGSNAPLPDDEDHQELGP